MVECSADVRALERIRERVVDARAVGIELAAEQVVVETAASAGKRGVSFGGCEISAVRTEGKFGDGSGAGARPNLHDAGHSFGAVECALRPAYKLQAIGLIQRQRAEVESPSGFVNRDSVDNHFVVARFSAAHEQRS